MRQHDDAAVNIHMVFAICRSAVANQEEWTIYKNPVEAVSVLCSEIDSFRSVSLGSFFLHSHPSP